MQLAARRVSRSPRREHVSGTQDAPLMSLGSLTANRPQVGAQDEGCHSPPKAVNRKTLQESKPLSDSAHSLVMSCCPNTRHGHPDMSYHGEKTPTSKPRTVESALRPPHRTRVDSDGSHRTQGSIVACTSDAFDWRASSLRYDAIASATPATPRVSESDQGWPAIPLAVARRNGCPRHRRSPRPKRRKALRRTRRGPCARRTHTRSGCSE